MNIISVTGRNIGVLKKYLQKALELNIIDEVHYWNNTRNWRDEEYLKSISNLKRSSSIEKNYIQIIPLIENNYFEISIRASNDAHIKLINENIEYEIVLGGWNNNRSVVRKNNQEIHYLNGNMVDANQYFNFKIFVDDKLHIFKNDVLIISCDIDFFQIRNIYFKTGFGAVGDIKYITMQNHCFYFMDTEKNWNYYNDKQFENDIIIECDNIVFMDLNKLRCFIDFVKNNDYDSVSANVINNGICAHIQQKNGLIPKNVIDLSNDSYGVSLCENGRFGERLHNYFLENYKTFLNSEFENIEMDVSSNFFGCKGKNWHNDTRGLKSLLYTNFYVSHLSFSKQIESGMNFNELFKIYNELCEIEIAQTIGVDIKDIIE